MEQESQREKTKRCVYAYIYGSGPGVLAETLFISVSESKDILSKFLKQYPGIQRLREDIVIRLVRQGYITSLSQRRRYFPEQRGERVQRAAFNFLLQGNTSQSIFVCLFTYGN